MNSDTPILKPCPFCGGDAELDCNGSFKHYSTGKTLRSIDISCTKCPVSIRICPDDFPGVTPEIVIDYWNVRTIERENQQLRADLETAKSDRNKAAMQERQKYLPKIEELRADLKQCAEALITCKPIDPQSSSGDVEYDAHKVKLALATPSVQSALKGTK